MAVPSGDERDFAFARKYSLPIVATQRPPQEWFDNHGITASLDCSTWPDAYVGDGPYVNSKNDAISLPTCWVAMRKPSWPSSLSISTYRFRGSPFEMWAWIVSCWYAG